MDLEKLEAMAAEELSRNGLVGWAFRLGTARRRLGACNYRARRIEVSGYYALHTPEEAVRDTLLHEVAHAIAGPEAGHGPAWRAVAVRLGATPRSCDDSPETVVTPGDWQAECPACRRTHHRYRRPRSVSGYRCKCGARTPLSFEFKGDPALRPVVPVAAHQSAGWQARCPACGTVHRRTRRPKAGVWRCKCPQRGELTWLFVRNPGESG